MSKSMTWLQKLLFAPIIVLVLLLLLLLLSPFYFLYRTVLRLAVELVWGIHGKRVLMVYSRSPNWEQYIESTWLPRIGSHATVLNWSDRIALGTTEPLCICCVLALEAGSQLQPDDHTFSSLASREAYWFLRCISRL